MMRACLLVLCCTALFACSNESEGGSSDDPVLGARESESFPERFGIGRVASAAEIQAIDIDITPDGTGLPTGAGTAAHGAPIYTAKCASCHGVEGEGTPIGSALVRRNPGDAFDFGTSMEKERDKTIGNYWPYATTLFDYIRRAMPFDRPGSLTDDEVYALVAYLLHRNEIISEDAVMNAESLPRVVMPARDRFVVDDRVSSTAVK